MYHQCLLFCDDNDIGSQQSSMSRLSVQPDMRCSFERLETALRFLGVVPTEQQMVGRHITMNPTLTVTLSVVSDTLL